MPPMVRYAFVARGCLDGGLRVQVRGKVWARKGWYYQARASAYGSIFKAMPSFQPGDDEAIALKMLKY
ncbi:hypothetical protein OH491_22525 [Termitidicoccus mucosus]